MHLGKILCGSLLISLRCWRPQRCRTSLSPVRHNLTQISSFYLITQLFHLFSHDNPFFPSIFSALGALGSVSPLSLPQFVWLRLLTTIVLAVATAQQLRHAAVAAATAAAAATATAASAVNAAGSRVQGSAKGKGNGIGACESQHASGGGSGASASGAIDLASSDDGSSNDDDDAGNSNKDDVLLSRSSAVKAVKRARFASSSRLPSHGGASTSPQSKGAGLGCKGLLPCEEVASPLDDPRAIWPYYHATTPTPSTSASSGPAVAAVAAPVAAPVAGPVAGLVPACSLPCGWSGLPVSWSLVAALACAYTSAGGLPYVPSHVMPPAAAAATASAVAATAAAVTAAAATAAAPAAATGGASGVSGAGAGEGLLLLAPPAGRPPAPVLRRARALAPTVTSVPTVTHAPTVTDGLGPYASEALAVGLLCVPLPLQQAYGSTVSVAAAADAWRDLSRRGRWEAGALVAAWATQQMDCAGAGGRAAGAAAAKEAAEAAAGMGEAVLAAYFDDLSRM